MFIGVSGSRVSPEHEWERWHAGDVLHQMFDRLGDHAGQWIDGATSSANPDYATSCYEALLQV